MDDRKLQDTGVQPDDGFTGAGHTAGPGAFGGAGAATGAATGAGAVEGPNPAATNPAAAAAAVDVNTATAAEPEEREAVAEVLEAAYEVEPAGEPEAEPEEELDPLARAQAEADGFRDRFVRLQAEWDNFRKRTTAERAQERLRAAERLVERLLPIVDDLERAIEHSATANEASLKGGIAAVHTKLVEVLEREGVKTLDPKGEAFDAHTHQAVGKEDDASVPDETVTQVYQKGYEMGDRVLRPAMVVVSQGGPKREAE
jgi:molecular chaperone GrpE